MIVPSISPPPPQHPSLRKDNNMIDEISLISEIKIVMNEGRFKDYTSEAVLMEVIDMIMEQPKVGEWISVDKDVPHSGKENDLYDIVRVQFDDGTLGLGVYRKGDDDKWWARKDEELDMSYSTDKNVVAWHPLPEPWKGEQE